MLTSLHWLDVGAVGSTDLLTTEFYDLSWPQQLFDFFLAYMASSSRITASHIGPGLKIVVEVFLIQIPEFWDVVTK